ncbi:hypothetical protein PR048_004678, partial [Dryococelus australis]
MEFLYRIPFCVLEVPNLKIKRPSWFQQPSAMVMFALVLLSYFLVTGGVIYDVIVEPPSVGSTTDEHGHSRPNVEVAGCSYERTAADVEMSPLIQLSEVVCSQHSAKTLHENNDGRLPLRSGENKRWKHSCSRHREVAFMPYRVNGQYIMEGLASSFLFTMGGLGFVVLDQTHSPSTPKLNRILLICVGFLCIIVSFVTCWIFMRMKL